MKKLFSLVAVLAVSGMMMAANIELPMSSCGPDNEGGAGWDVTVTGNVINFTKAWECGAGWWFEDEDFSAYSAVVVEFNAYSGQVQLVMEYTDATMEKNAVAAGATKVRLAFTASKAAHVKQIFLQASAAGNLTVTKAYIEGENPYDITGKQGFNVAYEEGSAGVYHIDGATIDANPDNAIYEIKLNVTDPSQGLSYGIGSIAARSDYDDKSNTFANQNNGVGVSTYYFLGSELKKIGMKGGNAWVEDEYGLTGLTMNLWAAELKSIKVYTGGTALHNNAAEAKAVKMIENGQVVIIKNGVKYNVLGAEIK